MSRRHTMLYLWDEAHFNIWGEKKALRDTPEVAHPPTKKKREVNKITVIIRKIVDLF